MADDDIMLNYYNSLLRRSDMNLLQSRHWLNDRMIGCWFEYLENSCQDSSVCLVCPEVSQFIKLGSALDSHVFVEPLKLSSKSLVLFPVNDSVSLDHPGGSHWSLLVYDRVGRKYYHLDSLNGNNLDHAVRITKNLHLNHEKVFELECTQQENSYDCGVYVCCNAENIIRHCSVNKYILPSLPMLKLALVNTYRCHMLQVLLSLSGK